MLKIFIVSIWICQFLLARAFFIPSSTLSGRKLSTQSPKIRIDQPAQIPLYGRSLIAQRRTPLRDLLGLGPAEIAVTLVVALVLFGPETLKSLSKDVGKAAAELKEIPKTFKEGMEEGEKASQMEKMKALAAEKRKRRDEKLSGTKGDNENPEDDESNE